MSKTCTGFFFELEILNFEVSQWLVFIRQQGCLRGIPEMGAIFEAHIFAPRRKTSLACPVQRAPKHTIMSSAKQELTHFPHHPAESRGKKSSPPFFLLCQSQVICLSKGGEASEVLHPSLSSPLYPTFSSSYPVFYSLLFFLFLFHLFGYLKQTVVWSRLP